MLRASTASKIATHVSACAFAATLLACTATSPAPDQATPADLTIVSAQDLSGPTWTSFGQAFFASYCVSCHTPGGAASLQDFHVYADVKANAVNIRCGVAPASMPASGCGSSPAAGQFPIGTGPHPTDAEREKLVAWIDAGAPM